jgi:ribosomal protein L29
MKFKDIKNKTREDLNKLLKEKKESLRVFRFGGAGAKSKNVKEGKNIKKDIAKIMTMMAQIKNN